MAKPKAKPASSPVLIGSGGTILEALVGAPEPPHPLVGLFVHKSLPPDHEMCRNGWNYERSGRVHSVVGEVAMLQFFSVWDGGLLDSLEPVSITDLLGGDWKLWTDYNAFRDASAVAIGRLYHPEDSDWQHIQGDRKWARATGDELRTAPEDSR